MSDFFKGHSPNIKLASELAKDLLISDLASSATFASTHIVMAKLARVVDELTIAQRNEIVDTAISNNQVYWIIGDEDVSRFLNALIKGYEDEIDSDKLAALKDLMNEEEDRFDAGDEDDDLPF